MDSNLKKIIKDYSLQKINKAVFLERFPSELLHKPNMAKDIILQGIYNKNNEDIDLGYILMLIQNDICGYDIDTNTLCLLLANKNHFHHEDIAMLLKELKSSNTVDCLYSAAEQHYDYLDYDDTYQFARKCIKALSAIGNENAIEKLKLLTNSKISEIAEYAKKELRYKGLL